MARRKYSKSKMLKAIQKSGGIKIEVCRRLGCSRQTFDNYLKDDEELRTALQAEIDDIGDIVEAKLIENIKKGDIAAIIFYAKTKLKDRGYTERHEIDNKTPISITVLQEEADV